LDEVVLRLHDKEEAMREAAVNTIASFGSKEVVPLLCEMLPEEQSLRVRARITRTLELLTKERFHPLDFDAVSGWWKQHSKEKSYSFDWQPLFKAQELLESDPPKNKEGVELLASFIEKKPDAIYARFLRAITLLDLHREKEVDEELAKMAEVKNDYRWVRVLRSIRLLQNRKKDEAIASINEAMKQSPALEKLVKSMGYFNDLLSDPKIEWPSQTPH
jgi:predicted Zn-dependent protease